MAVALAVNDLVEVRVGCYSMGQAGINILHYVCTAVAGTGASLETFATNMDLTCGPVYKAAMHNQATYYGVRVQRLRPSPASLAIVEHAIVGIGTSGDAPLPGQVSGIVTKRTQLAGRANRGRMYIPFPADSDSDGATNQPTDDYVDKLDAIANAILVPIVAGGAGNTATMTPVIYRRATNTYQPITGDRANQKWATQRRRGNFGQVNAYPPF